MNTDGYRADIDALRCIAVLGVVFYHFKIGPFQGGFVGVDVFFVISGYLITGILLTGFRAGDLTLTDFYVRRFRRLMPALGATIIVSLLAAYFVFFPEDLARHGFAAIGSLLGASNLLFWHESGYFDVSSIRKPLLHTWSLSVEFQFYAVWPFLVLLLAKVRDLISVITLIALSLVSFVLAEIVLRADSAAAFFIMPSRMWEFAVGGLLVFVERPRSNHPQIFNGIYIAGFLIVVATFVGYRPTTTFPGFTALPPVVGTAAMIYSGPRAPIARVISASPVRFIGKISYSLYLVHWPAFVFAIYFVGDLSKAATAALLLATLLCTILLHRLVEEPLRRTPRRPLHSYQFRIAFTVSASIVIAVGSYAYTSGGLFAFRASDDTVIRALNAYDVASAKTRVWQRYAEFEQRVDFTTSKRRVLLVGDSQSADLLNMWIDAGVDNEVEVITNRVYYECGVPFLPESMRFSFWSRENPLTMKAPALIELCNAQMARLISLPALRTADVVVVAFLWKEFARPHVATALATLQAEARGRMLIVGNKAFVDSSVRIINDAGKIAGIERVAAERLHPETRSMNALLRELYPQDFVDLLPAICESDGCRILTNELRPVYWDSTHWTKEGAAYIWQRAGRKTFSFLSPPRDG